MERRATVSLGLGSHDVSQHLTSLDPQPPHKGANDCRSSWSQGFEHIFCNEGVGGSNPPSSTKRPGQSDIGEVEPFLDGALPHVAPRVPHWRSTGSAP